MYNHNISINELKRNSNLKLVRVTQDFINHLAGVLDLFVQIQGHKLLWVIACMQSDIRYPG